MCLIQTPTSPCLGTKGKRGPTKVSVLCHYTKGWSVRGVARSSEAGRVRREPDLLLENTKNALQEACCREINSPQGQMAYRFL